MVFVAAVVGLIARFIGQDQVQRLIACKGGLKGARKAQLVSLSIIWFFAGLSIVTAIAAISFTKGCKWWDVIDVNMANLTMKQDETVPFMTGKLLTKFSENGKYPVIGLYLAVVYAGSLSTTSSFLNSISMLALTDILPAMGVKIEENKKLYIARLTVLVAGLVIMILTLALTLLGTNMFMIFMILSGLMAPVILVAICAASNVFGKIGPKAITVATVVATLSGVLLTVLRKLDPAPKELEKILPLHENCYFNASAVDLNDIYHVGLVRNDEVLSDASINGFEILEFGFVNILKMGFRPVYWMSRNSVCAFVTFVFWAVGNLLKLVLKNDGIGMVQMRDNFLQDV